MFPVFPVLKEMQSWLADVHSYCKKHSQILLVGNKVCNTWQLRSHVIRSRLTCRIRTDKWITQPQLPSLRSIAWVTWRCNDGQNCI